MSLFKFYEQCGVAPQVNDEIKFECGVTKKVTGVKRNTIQIKETVPCACVMDLSKAVLFRDGKAIRQRINGAEQKL